jgi:integrase
MAESENPPKSAQNTPASAAGQSEPQKALFDTAENQAAALMGWLPVENALKADMDAIYARARDLSKMARSENTRRSYRTAWAQYETWCAGVDVKPLSGDPGTVALYLSVLSKKVQPSTLKARLAAISVAHRLAGHPLDTSHEAIKLILRGAAREKGLAPKRQARALHYSALPALMDVFTDSPLDLRNKAIVLVGFAGALRRSEIAALMLTEIIFQDDGMLISLPRAKGDVLGRGEAVYVSAHPNPRLCPLTALKSWLKVRGDTEGPLFLRANRNQTFRDTGIAEQTVNRVIKNAVGKLGFDPEKYSGHSLRSGLATSAADAGLDLKAIMNQTRLRSARQAMTYVRDAERKRDNITRQLFVQPALKT